MGVKNIMKELKESGITINGRSLDELDNALFELGYWFSRAHGLNPKEAYDIALEALNR